MLCYVKNCSIFASIPVPSERAYSATASNDLIAGLKETYFKGKWVREEGQERREGKKRRGGEGTG